MIHCSFITDVYLLYNVHFFVPTLFIQAEIIMTSCEKIKIDHNIVHDYVGIFNRRVEPKPLIIISDTKAKERQLYIIHRTWLNCSTGTVEVPSVVGTTNTRITEEVMDILLQHEYAAGTPTVFAARKQYSITWSKYTLRSVYEHFGLFLSDIRSL